MIFSGKIVNHSGIRQFGGNDSLNLPAELALDCLARNSYGYHVSSHVSV
jgi:hypothetical protein